MVALVDCNNFYASCERLFNPRLAKKPVVVLSNNDGCVIARSDEAKAIGIKMGTPAFMITKILEKNQVEVFSSNYTLYGSLSNRVLKTLSEFTPDIEVYSIDEAFLDLNNIANINLQNFGEEVKQTVLQHVGIPVSVGVAPTKTLAKMANRFSKKKLSGKHVHIAEHKQQIKELLKATEIGDVWGIGSQYKSTLLRNGIKTAEDFTHMNEDWIRKNMTVVGLRLYNELKGIPSVEWESVPPPKKVICTARSFGRLLSAKDEIAEAIANYANKCALKLRKQNSCTTIINVFVQTNTHRIQDKQYYRSVNIKIPVATNSSKEIISHSLKGFEKIYVPDLNYKKAGVMMMNIIPNSFLQSGMFDTEDRGRDKKLMASFDEINSCYGKDMLRFATQGYSEKWHLKQEQLSPCYTTRLNDVYVIKN